jgi:hypothetical protein
MNLPGLLAGRTRPPSIAQSHHNMPAAPKEWERASFALEVQLRHIDRATHIAQSLLAVLTLTGALAGPLLVIGAGRSLLDGLFGALLIVYLTTLGNAVRHCMHVTWRRMVSSESFDNPLHFHYIAKFKTGDEYVSYLQGQRGEDWLSQTQAYAWLMARVMNCKRSDIRKAIRWTMLSLLLLASLVVFRFAAAFLSS